MTDTSQKELHKFDAVVFDMDGVLIDSEPFWYEAERETMAEVGIDLTHELYQQTMGLRVNEVVQHWQNQMPWADTYPDIANEKLEVDIMNGVTSRVSKRGQMLPGVLEAIELFRSYDMKIGLASSSLYRIIDSVVDALDLRKHFDDLYSAEDEPFGKPDPGVYLRAAKRLGVNPTRCIAIEDSVNGVRAAVAANYTCIAVPDVTAWEHTPERFTIANIIVPSLTAISDQVLQGL